MAIQQAPRIVPAATLDTPAAPLLAEVLRSDGRVTVVSFIYASCNSVCLALGSEFQRMQAQIARLGLQDQVRLMSISFDPRDTATQLAVYAKRQQANGKTWQISGIASAAGRKAVLDAFGVVVLPAPLGEFVHNTAFHIVDANGRLVKIDDFDQPDQALADAVAIYHAGRL
ncbi:SCO family protein [Duganella flavida]|uniref:SCO family protein n=1 Tax=Duganella flavida TaxID=2692175 RepID=UPI001E335F53|nr:SCO family protein [Duganella flavida]